MAVAALGVSNPGVEASARARLGAGSRVRLSTLLCLSLFLIIVGNLGRVPLLDGGKKEAPLLFTDLVVVAVVATGALAASRNRRLELDRPAQFAVAFAAIGALSAVLAIPRFGLTGFQFFFSIAYLIRWVVYFGIYLVVTNVVQRYDLERIWRSLEKGILIFATFGIFQSIFLPGFAQMVQPEAAWDRQGHRLVSSFLDPNFAGGFIMIGILILLARLASGVTVARWKLVVLAAALLMTLSRSSLLATLIGTGVIFAVRGLSRRLLGVGMVMMLLLIPALPSLFALANSFGRFSLEGSGAQRIIVWLQALEMIRDHPIIGIGFNTYGYVQEYYNHADDLGGFHYFSLDGGLLFITVMTGAVGLILYGGMLVAIVLRGRRVAVKPDLTAEERGLGLGVAAVTVAMVIHSLFLNSLLFTLLMQPLWALWGMTALLDRPERPEGIGTGSKREPMLIALGRE